jgi:predicted RNA-binding protein with PUA-like domain
MICKRRKPPFGTEFAITKPGIAGLAEIVGLAEPDPSQFDKKSEYFDPKASKDKPRWFGVRVGFKEKFKNFVPLETLRTEKPLKNMLVIKKGQRLSIQPVQAEEFECIRKLSQRP